MTFRIGTPHSHNEGFMETRYSADHATKRTGIKSCPHCQAIVELGKADDWCPKCDGPICRACAIKMATEGCIPFIKQVEQAMEQNERRRQLRRILGT